MPFNAQRWWAGGTMNRELISIYNDFKAHHRNIGDGLFSSVLLQEKWKNDYSQKRERKKYDLATTVRSSCQ